MKKKYRVGKNFKIVKRSCSLNRYYRVFKGGNYSRKYGMLNYVELLMGHGIGLGLSSMAVCFAFRSTNEVQLSNRKQYVCCDVITH
jgi:hypothetical protein